MRFIHGMFIIHVQVYIDCTLVASIGIKITQVFKALHIFWTIGGAHNRKIGWEILCTRSVNIYYKYLDWNIIKLFINIMMNIKYHK